MPTGTTTPSPRADMEQPTAAPGSVCVVITTYNHAQFLGEALDSVLAQTRGADEIIVVDDGSNDDPGAVTARFPAVRLISQKNQGPSAARNAGLTAATSDLIVFLDADDRLLPRALELGVRGLALAPEAVFTFGGHRRIDAQGQPMGGDRPAPPALDYAELLQTNRVAMLSTVTFRRQPLLAIGGFDTAVRGCEDYDVYLRLARDHPLATFPDTVAEYRQHPGNTSRNAADMLAWALKVLDRQHQYASRDPILTAAWKSGRVRFTDFYRELMPKSFGQRLLRKLTTAVPALANHYDARRRAPWGQVRFGDLDRPSPISNEAGHDRGTPVDTAYIEAFLAQHSADIAGHVLEGTSDALTRRFGAAAINRQDVLHVSRTAPQATIVGELSSPGVLGDDGFDCIVLTETLPFVYNLEAAIHEIHRGLKPGGVALVTAPGILRPRQGRTAYWSLTQASAARLFAQVFGAANVTVETRGNVFAATAFLHGVAVDEFDRSKLARIDPDFPVIITIRARKEIG